MQRSEEDKLIRSLQRGQTIKLAIVLTVVASPLLYILYGTIRSRFEAKAADERAWQEDQLTPADETEFRGLLAGHPAELQRAAAAWRAVTRRATLEAIAPTLTGDEPGCSVGRYTLEVVDAGAEVPLESRELRSDAAEIERYTELLDAGSATKSDLRTARELDRPAAVAIVLVETQTPPIVTGISPGLTFIPGRTTGMAYLFEPSSGRVACAGDISATNSEAVEFSYSYYENAPLDQDMKAREAGRAKLDEDLAKHLDTAVREGMRVLPISANP